MDQQGTAKTKFRGESIELGGVTYEVPPLSLRSVRDLLPRIQAAQESGSPPSTKFDAMLEVIHSAIARNYPDVTLDELLDVIDLGNVIPIFRGVMGRSGLIKAGGDTAGNSEPGTASP